MEEQLMDRTRPVSAGRRKTRLGAALAAGALVLALAACSSGGAGSPAAPAATGGVYNLTIVTSNNGIQWTPIDAMAKDGIAKKHGLTVKLSVFQNGSGASSLIFTGGTGDILMGGMDAPVNFLQKKALDVTVVGAIEKENPFVLVSKAGSPYSSVESLRGQIVGVSGAGSFSDYSARNLLKSSGVATTDVKIAALGAGPAQVAALTGGRAAAVMLQSPAYESQLSAKKIQVVHNLRNDGPTPAIVAMARTSAVQKDAKPFAAFLAAWKEELAKMTSDPAHALSAASAYLGDTVDQKDIQIQVDAFLGGIWSLDGVFDQKLYDAGKSLLVGSGAFQADLMPSFADLTKGAPAPAE
jgi:ABC-type nitrate/sulfonate/bicarbonate transport system substrate-binding protein